MNMLIGLSGAIAAFFLVATLTGHAEHIHLRLPRTERHRIPRHVWLRQAGVTVTPFQFWAVSMLSGATVEIICWNVGGSWVVGAVPALAAGLGPRAYFSRRRSVQLAAVVEDWPQGIRDLLASVEGRRSIHYALLELVRSGPLALRVAFANYETLSELAGPVTALATIRDELADPITDRIMELLIVAQEEGQDLVLQILRDQAGELGEDLRVSAEIRQAQHEPRMVARAAFVLPWLGLVMLCASVPAYRSFYATSGGFTAALIAGLMSGAGMALARRLSRETTEPRVIGVGV